MHFNPIPLLRWPLNFLIGKALYRLRFDATVTEAYTFHNFRHKPDEYLASINILIQNHNDHPLLISTVELSFGDVCCSPTSSMYIYENSPLDSLFVAPFALTSTSFPFRVEAHSHANISLYFDVGLLDIPEATLNIIIGKYRRSIPVQLHPGNKL